MIIHPFQGPPRIAPQQILTCRFCEKVRKLRPVWRHLVDVAETLSEAKRADLDVEIAEMERQLDELNELCECPQG